MIFYLINKLLRHLKFIYDIAVSCTYCVSVFLAELFMDFGFNELSVLIGKHLSCIPKAVFVDFPLIPNIDVAFFKPTHII